MMIRPVIRHNMQMSLFATCHFQYFVQKSLFYVPSNVFRHLNIGVKTMKCFCSVWRSTLCQTAAITAYASCSFKRWELRRGSCLTQGQSDILHLFLTIRERKPTFQVTRHDCSLRLAEYEKSGCLNYRGDTRGCPINSLHGNEMLYFPGGRDRELRPAALLPQRALITPRTKPNHGGESSVDL